MEDFGEYTPLDSVSANGMDGTRCTTSTRSSTTAPAGTTRRAVSPAGGVHPLRLDRGAPVRPGGLGWRPDTAWGFDGLDSAVKQALSLGTSGICRWGSDIGGFFSLLNDQLTPEMLLRWIEFGPSPA